MGNTVQPLRSSFANADLVACLLTSLPDFDCLASAILTSKIVYNVFQQHPLSIVRAVAYNLVGPALPQALRFVRCKNARLYSRPVDELLSDDDIQNNPTLSSQDIRSLVAVSNVVQALENLFSLRMKDRKFKTSQLSLEESTRFQKALYRLTLFSEVYGVNAYDSALQPDSEEELELSVEEAKKHRKGFFNSFTTPELREIQRVELFLRGTLAGVSGRPPDSNIVVDWAIYSIYYNPAHLLELFNEATTSLVDEWDVEVEQCFWVGFMETPLNSVLTDRKEPYLLPSAHKNPIIDKVIGEHDLCSQCQSDKGLELCGPSNWNYIRARPLFHTITQLLKGYLNFNQADIGNFNKVVQEASPEQLIGGLFEYKTLDYYTWNKDDWLCEQCLEKFMRDHLHIWYVGQKVKRGYAIPENCWYGYNCRTQTHKPAHAGKLNHWCAPIRGDSPPA